MDEACVHSNGVIEKLWKEKLAKIEHFNDNISRLSNEIDILKIFELRWRLKIFLINNIVENIYLIWCLSSFKKLKKKKNDVCRMTLNESDAEKKTKNWRKGTREQKFFQMCVRRSRIWSQVIIAFQRCWQRSVISCFI